MLRCRHWIAIAGFMSFALRGIAQTPTRAWTPALLKDASAWSIHMNDGSVSAGADGLHVAIAPGKTWAIAAAPVLKLPANTAHVRINVSSISPGGRWLIRLFGRFRGREKAFDFSPFYNMKQPGSFDMELDPRLLESGANGEHGEVPGGVMVQLGLEGDPGAHVVFSELTLEAGAVQPKHTGLAGQIALPSVDLIPDLPSPYKMLNWKLLTARLDKFIFDNKTGGEYLPLLWIDRDHINSPLDTFGMPSYVGGTREKNGIQEGVTCIGAVLGPSLIGIDKSKQQHNWVKMCEAFCNGANGSNLVLNLQNQPTGGSFWYEIWPHIAFYGLVSKYPDTGRLAEIMRTTAG